MASRDDAPALDGQVILITGASRGIGRALALACAGAGATVIAAARNVRALESLADDIAGRGDAPPLLLPLNLQTASVDDYLGIAGHIAEQFGRLDGLVHGAAMLGDLTPLAHYDTVTWARVFQVNVHSALLLTQACWPLLLAGGHGSLIFTLAEEAYTAKANWGAYGVSKFALRGLFETWARESAGNPAVRVNAVIPQAVHTRLYMDAYPAADVERLPAPETVTDAYLHLLGAAGRALNGTALRAPLVRPD